MPCSINFTTKPVLFKRNRQTILGLYPEEKLARKMVKAGHIIRIPEPSLTIDAETCDQHLADKDDWRIIFVIDDGRRYWISLREFNQRMVFLGNQ